ncbi:MAG: MFS transporter [Bdellovibrionota bacterium]
MLQRYLALPLLVRKTVQTDVIRSIIEGPIVAGSQSLALLILLKGSLQSRAEGMHADMLQAVLFGGSFLGMMLSLAVLQGAARFRISKRWMMAGPSFASSASIFLAIIFYMRPIAFSVCLGLGFLFLALRLPVLTSIYHEIYPIDKRGRLTSISFMAYQLSTVIFYYFAGELLDRGMEYAPWLMGLWGLAAFLSGLVSLQLPTSERLETTFKAGKAFLLPFIDKWFGYVLLVWFVFGFANLWIYPLRVKYAVAELDLKPSTISLVLGVIPEMTRLMFLPFWAYLFDRINFILLRMILNFFLALGIGVLFFSSTATGVGVGAFIHAVGFSGGKLAWSLWITKTVSKTRSAEYMAVHVFFTGARGAFGPMLGALVLGFLGSYGHAYRNISMLSIFMILLSILMMIPILKDVSKEP